jgi:hypothetical protein
MMCGITGYRREKENCIAESRPGVTGGTLGAEGGG